MIIAVNIITIIIIIIIIIMIGSHHLQPVILLTLAMLAYVVATKAGWSEILIIIIYMIMIMIMIIIFDNYHN